jgi:hypothetical protein
MGESATRALTTLQSPIGFRVAGANFRSVSLGGHGRGDVSPISSYARPSLSRAWARRAQVIVFQASGSAPAFSKEVVEAAGRHEDSTDVAALKVGALQEMARQSRQAPLRRVGIGERGWPGGRTFGMEFRGDRVTAPSPSAGQ